MKEIALIMGKKTIPNKMFQWKRDGLMNIIGIWIKKKCNAIYFNDTVHLWINQQIYTEILLVSVWLFVHFHFVIKLHYWAKFSIVFFNRQFFAFLCLSIYSNISIYLSVSLWLSVRLFFCVYLSNIRLFIKKKIFGFISTKNHLDA